MISPSLPRPVRRYFDNWFASHNPPSRDAIVLHNRRLYILPTRFGYLFAVMLLFLFLAAINYQNSMAVGLTFMLTSLGIIIGVTSVIAVVSIVQGLSYTINEQFAGLGGNSLTIRSYTPFKKQLQGQLAKLRDSDLELISRRIEGISHITPILFT